MLKLRNGKPMSEVYDVIIVGSGPAGLTAAIYTTRASLKTLVIAGAKWGGQLQLTTDVENFPGFPEGIQGPELMMAMRKQAEKFGTEFIDDDMPSTDLVKTPGGPFSIQIGQRIVTGKTVLIATGADAKTLGVNGEGEFTGHGVSYCATCDGAFFRNKEIVVVGGGDSAMEEAQFLTNFATHVTVLYRGDKEQLRASQIMKDRCMNNPKISFMYNSVITEILGTGKVTGIKIKTTPPPVILSETKDLDSSPMAQNDNSEEKELSVEGIFVAIGHTPNTKVFPGIEVTERGFVTNQYGTKTNVEGVFVSGDVQDDRYMQAITAAGYGCMAALDIERYLAEKAH